MSAQEELQLENVIADETGDCVISVRSDQASGGPTTDSITLLRAGSNKSLAKIWATDDLIIPAANATWFEGKEIQSRLFRTSATYST